MKMQRAAPSKQEARPEKHRKASSATHARGHAAMGGPAESSGGDKSSDLQAQRVHAADHKGNAEAHAEAKRQQERYKPKCHRCCRKAHDGRRSSQPD